MGTLVWSPLAEKAGIPLTHLAMAFAIAHPGVRSAIIGPRTMEHLDDLLAGLDGTLTDEILDRIDEIVPPGTDIGLLDMPTYHPARSADGLEFVHLVGWGALRVMGCVVVLGGAPWHPESDCDHDE